MSERRTSLRELRLSQASNLLSTSRIKSTLAPSAILERPSKVGAGKGRNFRAAPSQRLKLDNGGSRDWSSRADAILKKHQPKKETRRVRKKREWLARLEARKDEAGNRLAENPGQSQWAYIPDLILEQIFKYLPIRSKISAALACKLWSRCIKCRSVWSDLVFYDNTMSRTRYNFAGKVYECRLNAGVTCKPWAKTLAFRSIWSHLIVDEENLRQARLMCYKYNYFSNTEEDVLDTVTASNALNKISHKLRQISFLPKVNLHNTCVFQRLMTKFCERQGSLPDIERFSYTFPCDFARKSNEVDIYGTGGMILQDMKALLNFFPGLKKLELIDLELDGVDAAHVLDEVSTVCAENITNLVVVNPSRRPYSLLAVSTFVNLRSLTISPHNLGDDLAECIGDMPRLRNLIILTNQYTECIPTPVDYRVWKQTRKTNPRLRVHLMTEGKHSKEITFQTRAPVKSVVYDTPYTRVSNFAINIVVEMYRTDLECYAHKRLPRFPMAKSFFDRPDTSYLFLVRQCPYLHTLMIRERISSATVLLIAYTGKNLRYLHVRRNAIVLRCEWPKNPDWSWDFFKWLRKSSRSYEDMEKEVSQILGFRWYALNDKQFKLTPLNLTVPYYYEGFEEN